MKQHTIASGVVVACALLSAGVHACELSTQPVTLPLQQFQSHMPNTLELESQVQIQASGDCTGTATIAFTSDVGTTQDFESPAWYIASQTQPLYHNYRGQTGSKSFTLTDRQATLEIPLRIVVDASKASKLSDLQQTFVMTVNMSGSHPVSLPIHVSTAGDQTALSRFTKIETASYGVNLPRL